MIFHYHQKGKNAVIQHFSNGLKNSNWRQKKDQFSFERIANFFCDNDKQ